MWFKNLQIFRLALPFKLDAETLHQKLATHTYTGSSSSEPQIEGWQRPADHDLLVHQVGTQWMLLFASEKKLLPASVINQVTKARALELEEQQGFPPGRKALKNLKELVREELLPRAFSIVRSTRVWIDTAHGWLIIDTPSPSRADEVLKYLLKCYDFPISALRVSQSPQSAMTDWLLHDAPPKGFTIDQNTELRSSSDEKATIKYANHTVDVSEIQRHITTGKRCSKLALTWNDRVSFVLTDALLIKQIKALNIVDEQSVDKSADAMERSDADFAHMAGDLSSLLDDLIFALGGEAKTM